MTTQIILIGAGIGGLTAGALLAQKGYQVTIYEQATIAGGCASTFQRKGFTFDVGATQVAGLEIGGIHQKIFKQLDIEPPHYTPCDPACAVFLPDETEPINVWYNPEQWQQERQKQFPNSEPFWQLLKQLFLASWSFQQRNPIIPPRNLWDIQQLLKAIRLDTLITLPFTLMTVGDLLKIYGLYENQRLKTFLDLQLKLYSQVNADETALLYAATALSVSQYPRGLYHLQGSMQELSNRLIFALEKYGGKLITRHQVINLNHNHKKITEITIKNKKTGAIFTETVDQIIANIPLQNLTQLLTPTLPEKHFFPLSSWLFPQAKIPEPSGAFVLYLGVDRTAIPKNCPPHLQFLYNYQETIGENNSLFVSVSKPNDGRTTPEKAIIIASTFTDPNKWSTLNPTDYQQQKQAYTDIAIKHLGQYFTLTPDTLIHQESATPRTFAHYTAREKGIVGGLGQRIPQFGPFGVSTRTPLTNLWLVGDSTHPGEGTAGVSYSAWTVVQQLTQ